MAPIRLGLLFVNGLRAEIGHAIAAVHPSAAASRQPNRCPKCGCDDASMIEIRSRGYRQPGYRLQAVSRLQSRTSAASPQPGARSLFL